jgi:hypothetical protein
MLGITTGAVRNRLSRGTLKSVKEGGTVYVLLPADTLRDTERDTADTPGGMPHDERDALISEMRSHLDDLRAQLEAERQGHAEARRLLAAALERIPPQIEAPSEPPSEPEKWSWPATGAEAGERAQGQEDRAGAGEGEIRRPWWRRLWEGY